jgi:hypothetical protein
MNRGVPCKYIVNKEDCPYGKKCRFLHQFRADLRTNNRENGDRENNGPPPQERRRNNSGVNVVSVYGESSEGQNAVVQDEKRGDQSKDVQQVCRFYLLNSRCKFGDRCRYAHILRDRAVKEKSDVVSNEAECAQDEKQSSLRQDGILQLSDPKHKDGSWQSNSRQDGLSGNHSSQQTNYHHEKKPHNSRLRQGDSSQQCTPHHENNPRLRQSGSSQQSNPHHENNSRLRQGGSSQQTNSHHENKPHSSRWRQGDSSQQSNPHHENKPHSSRLRQGGSSQSTPQPRESSRDSDSRNPPPLTLASFIGGRTHVQRPHKASRGTQKNSAAALREVCGAAASAC